MNNTVIKVLNKEHGGEVIAYFKSLGFDTGMYKGDCEDCYYGVKDKKFSYWCNIPYGCKVVTLPEKTAYPKVMMVGSKPISEASPGLKLENI